MNRLNLALSKLRHTFPSLLFLLLMTGGISSVSAQSTLWSESFETDGNGSRYTATEFSDGSGDFFTRTDGGNIIGSYAVTGSDSSFFFAAMDTDGEPQGGDIVTLTFNPINISGYSSLEFSGLFAEDDDGSNQDWDANALVFVEANIDGAGWVKILQFATGSPGFNQEPLQDTDLDGTGDGPALTSTFASFSANIAGSGSLLEIRITSEFLDAGDEDIAFDLLAVEGLLTGGGCTDVAYPMVVCQSVTLSLDENGMASLDPADLDGGSTDDCTPDVLLSFFASQTTFTCADITGGPAIASDLFISEYVEGSSFNKYIEIFNGTGSDVDLSNYELRLYPNGSASPSTTNTLSGTLADGQVVVLANGSATLYTGPTTTATAVNFNGDDAVALYNNGTSSFADIFGTIGEDPGSQWNVGGNNTKDMTLRRNGSVSMGVTSNPAPGFATLGSEWMESNKDDVSGLGTHSLDASGISVIFTVTDESGKSSACYAEVFIEDNLGPNILCTSPTIMLDANGQATLTAEMIDNGTADNCSDVTLSIDKTSFDCEDAASITTGDDIFISEYVEGSGFTKYVELYNGTGATIDLSAYEFRLYSNGSPVPTSSQALSGMLPNGQVVVLANPAASAYGGNTQMLSAVNFNGDDAVEIYNMTTKQSADIFGTIGQDPGSQWSDSGSGNSTANATLRRKSSISGGVTTNPGPGFPTLGTEWDGFANNDVSGLGAHTVDQLPGIPVTLTAMDAAGNTSTCTTLVNVVDNMAPVAMCQDINIQLDVSGTTTIDEGAVNNGSYDNCDITFDTDITSFTSADIGSNPVVMTVTDGSGNSSSCTATVNVFAKGPAVFGFVLYNADTDQPIMPLVDGAKINLPALGTNRLAIRALPGTDPLESMRLILNGPVNRNQLENNAPYFSFGDHQGSGDVYGKGFKSGVYTFSATPYDQNGGKGTAGVTQTITFEMFVPDPEIEDFALVNPTTDQVVVDPMTDGEIVDLSALGGSFTIMANVNLGDIESVGMAVTDMNGDVVHAQVENNFPYALFGDGNGNFDPGILPDGMYTLSAVAFTDDNLKGTPSPIATVDFVVTGGAASSSANGGLNSIDGDFSRAISVYPNPASFTVNVDLSAYTGEEAIVTIMNEIGQEVWTREIAEIGSDAVTINLGGNRFTEGIYLIRLVTATGETQTKRFIVSK